VGFPHFPEPVGGRMRRWAKHGASAANLSLDDLAARITSSPTSSPRAPLPSECCTMCSGCVD
jgi:hypothetical protein